MKEEIEQIIKETFPEGNHLTLFQVVLLKLQKNLPNDYISYTKEDLSEVCIDGEGYDLKEMNEKIIQAFLDKLDRFGGFCTNCKDRMKDIITKKEL